MTTVSSGLQNTSTGGSTEQDTIREACDVIDNARGQTRYQADNLARNFDSYLQEAHLAKSGENPPSTAQGVYPTIPSKGYLEKCYGWTLGLG